MLRNTLHKIAIKTLGEDSKQAQSLNRSSAKSNLINVINGINANLVDINFGEEKAMYELPFEINEAREVFDSLSFLLKSSEVNALEVEKKFLSDLQTIYDLSEEYFMLAQIYRSKKVTTRLIEINKEIQEVRKKVADYVEVSVGL